MRKASLHFSALTNHLGVNVQMKLESKIENNTVQQPNTRHEVIYYESKQSACARSLKSSPKFTQHLLAGTTHASRQTFWLVHALNAVFANNSCWLLAVCDIVLQQLWKDGLACFCVSVVVLGAACRQWKELQGNFDTFSSIKRGCETWKPLPPSWGYNEFVCILTYLHWWSHPPARPRAQQEGGELKCISF